MAITAGIEGVGGEHSATLDTVFFAFQCYVPGDNLKSVYNSTDAPYLPLLSTIALKCSNIILHAQNLGLFHSNLYIYCNLKVKQWW